MIRLAFYFSLFLCLAAPMVWAESFRAKNYLPDRPKALPADLNIRADCSETPVTLDQIISAAQNPAVTGQTEFLRSLPKHSLQTFTFITKSESPEEPCISEKYPGVIRTSIDGSITMRYTCDPGCALYNRVQILEFGKNTKHWKPAELVLRENPDHRVNLKPTSCVNCHSASNTLADLKPNWQQYQTWRGFMGEEDDNLSKKLVDSGIPEKERFESFKARIQSGDLKDNPCYTELPWYTGSAKEYEHYPYSTEDKSQNYDLRPNAKFTDIYSHLMAQRLARRFEEQPAYPRIKYRMLAESLDCPHSRPNFDSAATYEKYFHQDLKQGGALRTYGEKLGIPLADFTMHFRSNGNFKYATAVEAEQSVQWFRGNDATIYELTEGELLRGMAAESAEFKPFLELGRGVTNRFGDRFSCIDDLGGRISLNENGISKLCAKLKEKEEEMLAPPNADISANAETCEEPKADTGHALPGLLGDALKILEAAEPASLDPIRVQHGKDTLQKSCVHCHSPGSPKALKPELQFFGNEKEMKKALCQTNLLAKSKERMNSEFEPMPPFGSGYDNLSKAELNNVGAYLSSLRKNCEP